MLENIRNNDPSTVVFKVKEHVFADINSVVFDAIVDALAVNKVCQAIYIQNLSSAIFDDQVRHLIQVLKKKKIWCVNIGENYEVSTRMWEEFCRRLPETFVTHLYVSEHVIPLALKNLMREHIRANRKKHQLHCAYKNLDVIERCTNMWWNPINGVKELKPYVPPPPPEPEPVAESEKKLKMNSAIADPANVAYWQEGKGKGGDKPWKFNLKRLSEEGAIAEAPPSALQLLNPEEAAVMKKKSSKKDQQLPLPKKQKLEAPSGLDDSDDYNNDVDDDFFGTDLLHSSAAMTGDVTVVIDPTRVQTFRGVVDEEAKDIFEQSQLDTRRAVTTTAKNLLSIYKLLQKWERHLTSFLVQLVKREDDLSESEKYWRTHKRRRLLAEDNRPSGVNVEVAQTPDDSQEPPTAEEEEEEEETAEEYNKRRANARYRALFGRDQAVIERLATVAAAVVEEDLPQTMRRIRTILENQVRALLSK
eukprot:gene4538-3245_t